MSEQDKNTQSMSQMGIIYVVATPIGHLGDISLRAITTLEEVDVILAEDTRTTKKLCDRYEISTPIESMHEYTDTAKIHHWIERINTGITVAMVSDAGTPTISDPGAYVIQCAHQASISVRTIPGPSSVHAALSISGIAATPYTFLGFLPKKKGRESTLTTIGKSTYTVVFFESPHRIEKTLTQLQEYISSDRVVAVVKEMTKIHEHVWYGTLADILVDFKKDPTNTKGEFVVIVSKQ